MTPSNLPLHLPTLIGREDDINKVRDYLLNDEIRLVTLTGPPGVGKTQLSKQVGARIRDEDRNEFEDGIYYVNLAPVTDPNLVVPSIAEALNDANVLKIYESGSKPLLEKLKVKLRNKQILLLLNNFEQVAGEVHMLEELLEATDKLKILVNSRKTLDVSDVYQWQDYPVKELAEDEAVDLFVKRAQARKPGFALIGNDAQTVAEICRRLDRLPLCIELAAAWVPKLSLEAIKDRLKNNLGLLETLHSTIDSSYKLLNEGEKRLFKRLAVFQGGRTEDAIEEICNPKEGASTGSVQALELNVLKGISSLVDNSLLKREEQEEVGGKPRFIMLETIHDYAREELEKSGEKEELRRLHAEYFMELAEKASPELLGAFARPGKRAVKANLESLIEQWKKKLIRLDRERDNMQAALNWAIEKGQAGNMEAAKTGLRLGGALLWLWFLFLRGYLNEGRDQLETLLSLTKNEENDRELLAARIRAIIVAGCLAGEAGEYSDAHSQLQQSLVMCKRLDEEQVVRVFLCHSSNDKPQVGDLYRRLKADGIEPWLDKEDLLPGQNWKNEIRKAIRDFEIVLICLSRESITRTGSVQWEIKYARDRADEQPEGTIYMIPLKLEECEVPDRLRNWQWVNLFDEDGYEKLMRSLRSRADSLRRHADG